jgi:hypothetical protein
LAVLESKGDNLEIKPQHDDGSEPDRTTVAHADVSPDEPIFDVWCRICGQSGSFEFHPMDSVQWYP